MDRDWEDKLKEESLSRIIGGLIMSIYQKMSEKEGAEVEKYERVQSSRSLHMCKDVHYWFCSSKKKKCGSNLVP